MAITTIANKMATRNWSKSNFGAASLCYGEDNKCITATNISNIDEVVLTPVSDVSGALPGEYVSNKYTDLSKCLSQASILDEYQRITFDIDCGVYKGINTSGSATFLQPYLFKADLVYTNTKDLNIALLGNGGLNSEVAVTIRLICKTKSLIAQQFARAEKTIIVPVSDIANEQIINTLISEEISRVLPINKPTVDNPNLNLTVKDFLTCFIIDMYKYYSGSSTSDNAYSIYYSISPTSSLYPDTKYRPTLHETVSAIDVTAIETDLSAYRPTPSISCSSESHKMSNGNFWFDIYVNVYSPKFTDSDGSINTSNINSLQFNITRGTFNTFNKSIAYNFNDGCDVVHIFGVVTPDDNIDNIIFNPLISIEYSPSGYNTKTLSHLMGGFDASGYVNDVPTFISTIVNDYLCITAIDNCTIKFTGSDIKYINDRGLQRTDVDIVNDWDTLINGNTLSLSQGDMYFFKADNLTPTSANGIGKFNITGRCNVSGNIMSMLYGNDTSDSLVGYDYAFYELFYSCDIVNASKNLLPATILSSRCYDSMFHNCTSLTVAPELPATTLETYCYYFMFHNCTSLTVAPELPATTLVSNCYAYMFTNCTSLTVAPELPATTLETYCYYFMFNGCTSLTVAPELPATTLVSNCYAYMFNGCSNLCYIDAKFLTTPSTTYTSNWVNGVASVGLFIKNANAAWDVRGMNGIPSSWETITDDKLTGELGIIALEDNVNIEFIPDSNINKYPAFSLDDGNSWGGFNQNKSLSKGEYVLFNGEFDKWHANYNDNGIGSFVITGGKCAVFGNCLSLFYENLTSSNSWYIPNSNAFKDLFIDCTAIKIVTKTLLPATSLSIACYRNMFSGCTSLVTAPELPATLLEYSCYDFMFSGCTSLVTAPELPATSLAPYCYYGMFYNCTGLKRGPSIIPASRAPESCCAYMFDNCTSLIAIPELPADIIGKESYKSMFHKCGIKKGIKLPAEVLGEDCYADMFNDCKQMVEGPQILPAKVLEVGCYDHMFSGCDSLIKAPVLPATQLVNRCYSHMFGSCNSLNYIKAMTLTKPSDSNPDYTKNWLYGVSSSGTFVANKNATWPKNLSDTERTGSYIPLRWTIKYED